jgi:hypothetical protein
MRSTAGCYDRLREYVDTVPMVDCHDHTFKCAPQYTDPINFLCSHYFWGDLASASSFDQIERCQDVSVALEERWPLFEQAWKRTCHTGYAQVIRRSVKKLYGTDEISFELVKRIKDDLPDYTDPSATEALLEEAGIVARILDVHVQDEAWEVLDGTVPVSPRGRLAIPLPDYHAVRSREMVDSLTERIGRAASSLDEYLDICLEIFKKCKAFGVVAFKDQSAYSRPIDYGNPSRKEAEALFGRIMDNAECELSYMDESRPLDDYLFDCFMGMARDLDLPVQIHTGHMAGIYNEISKTNAVLFTGVLDRHHETRFDLFHANWPYSGELLFLCKNYPNARIDFCWAQIIDPVYCQNMMKQALSCVPHGKIHGHGSDYGGYPLKAWASASIARDSIAIALADMVEMEYLGLDDAKEVAKAWLFDSPNEFFRLGLDA